MQSLVTYGIICRYIFAVAESKTIQDMSKYLHSRWSLKSNEEYTVEINVFGAGVKKHYLRMRKTRELFRQKKKRRNRKLRLN